MSERHKTQALEKAIKKDTECVMDFMELER